MTDPDCIHEEIRTNDVWEDLLPFSLESFIFLLAFQRHED